MVLCFFVGFHNPLEPLVCGIGKITRGIRSVNQFQS